MITRAAPAFYKLFMVMGCVFDINTVHKTVEKLTFQCRSKGNISGGARKCWRREPLGRSGGMLPQKNLKSRDLEMLFPAFCKSYL